MSITHEKVSNRPDNDDPTQVQGSDWNGPHVIDGPLVSFISSPLTSDTVIQSGQCVLVFGPFDLAGYTLTVESHASLTVTPAP